MRVLDPVERVSEVVFGLLMALAITGSLSVADATREDVRTMMFAALGEDKLLFQAASSSGARRRASTAARRATPGCRCRCAT